MLVPVFLRIRRALNRLVNRDISTRDLTSRHVCLEVRFGFKKYIGSLSEGSVRFIFILMFVIMLRTLPGKSLCMPNKESAG